MNENQFPTIYLCTFTGLGKCAKFCKTEKEEMMFQDILVGVMGVIVVAVAIWAWRMDHHKEEEN